MPRRKYLVSRFALTLILTTTLIGTRSVAQNDANERLVTRMDSAQIALKTKTKIKSLDRHLVPELELGGAEIVAAGQQISVRYLARVAGPSAPAGSGITGKGRVQLTFNCIGAAGTEILAKQTVRFGKFGNAATQFNATPTNPCTRLRVVRKFKGAMTVAAGGTVAEKLTATPFQPLAARLGPPCTPDPQTLCLVDNRFQVEVTWQDFAGNNDGTVIEESQDSGLLYFFGPNNWEVLLKVLDGCDVNNHFWVFAAAATDVEYTLTVTDTGAGVVKQYGNALGTAAPAVTDTSAFATCP